MFSTYFIPLLSLHVYFLDHSLNTHENVELGMSLCTQETDRDAVTLPPPAVLKKEASELACPFVVSWNRNVEGANSFQQQQYSAERQGNGLILLPCWAEAILGLSCLIWRISREDRNPLILL